MAAIDGAKSQEDCKLKDMKPDLGEDNVEEVNESSPWRNQEERQFGLGRKLTKRFLMLGTLFREKVFKALGLRSMYLQNCGIYLRVNVIGAQDFEPSDRSQPPQAFVKVQVGKQILKTKLCPS
ncbi:hypothetical protein YC2023_034097 [Brassica napus]